MSYRRSAAALRSILCLVAAISASQTVFASSYLQEGFDYLPGILGTNAPWTNPTNLITVNGPNLTYPGLAKMAPGGSAASAHSTGATGAAVTWRPFETTATDGSVYFSFLLMFTHVQDNVYFAGMLPSSSTLPGGPSVDPCDIVVKLAGGGFNLGVRGKGLAATNAPVVLALNEAHLVVVKYNFATRAASLYLNPIPGRPEPVPDAVSLGSGTVPNLDHLFLRVGVSTAGDYVIDTVRIASTWEEVTPWAPSPPTAKLEITIAQSVGTAGMVIEPVKVQAIDIDGDRAATNNVPITLALDHGSFDSGVTTAFTDLRGKAVFSNLVINTPGVYIINALPSGVGEGIAAGSLSFEIGPTNVIGEQGRAISALLDSLDVEHYWAEGVSVNWLTGASGGSGPNMTEGKGSHCSAFAPAVAYLLDVYLLRPWDKPDKGLANLQADWLRTNTAGWFPIPSMTDAQHLANDGLLVVASCREPDGKSGHIAVVRPSERSDAHVRAYGPQICQSGMNNYNSTNVTAGFDQHPGAFPTRILYYGHTCSTPNASIHPVFGAHGRSNNTFHASATTVVGRTYRLQLTSDFEAWTTVLKFTNSNNSTNFFCITPLTDSIDTSASLGFYRLLAE
jgi:hypothetical protein